MARLIDKLRLGLRVIAPEKEDHRIAPLGKCAYDAVGEYLPALALVVERLALA